MVYEMVEHFDKDKVVARVAWDGQHIVVDNKLVEEELKSIEVHGYTFKDGLDFMKALPFYYRNGYVSLRRVKNGRK